MSLIWGCLLKYSLTSGGLGLSDALEAPFLGIVVVWSWSQVARILGSVGKKLEGYGNLQCAFFLSSEQSKL